MSRRNKEKYINFSVPIKKNDRIGKRGKEIKTKIIYYKSKFVDSAKSMASSFSNLVDNLGEEINKFKCKYEDDNKKYETYRIKFKDCEFC